MLETCVIETKSLILHKTIKMINPKLFINYGLSLILSLVLYLIMVTQITTQIDFLYALKWLLISWGAGMVLKYIYVKLFKAYDWSHSVWFNLKGEVIFFLIWGIVALISTTDLL